MKGILILALVSGIFSLKNYSIDDTHLIHLYPSEVIQLSHQEDEHKGIWAVGKYPNESLDFIEGRTGIITDKHQHFTVKCKKCKPGEEIWVDLWLVNSDTPELWFENKQGYIKTHQDAPIVKLIRFKLSGVKEL